MHKSQLSDFAKALVKFKQYLLDIDNNIKNEQEIFSQVEDKLYPIMSESLNNFIKNQLLKQQSLISEIMMLHEEIKKVQENLLLENQEMKKYEILEKKLILTQEKLDRIKEDKIIEDLIIMKNNENL